MVSADGAAAPDASALDDEIANLEAEAATLRKALKIQCSTILSSSTVPAAATSSPSSSTLALHRRPTHSKLGARSAQQLAYMQQCGYRTCTPVTAFKVHDPDPCAVDGGHVLGLRFEVMSRGQFLQPYYLMLNRPFSHAKYHLRVHRHTIPPAVPLAGLAARHLPAPIKVQGDEEHQPGQDLDRFARALRREIMRYHNRLGVSADLRRRLGLHEKTPAQVSANSIVEVGIADIEAKQIKLTWADERSGRLVMDDDGNILKLAVFGGHGRDWDMAKELFGKFDRMEDIARKLQEHGDGG
ncbi:cenp-O kinetochore centromere component domain-containing protein [Hirsutella rhossiliensis]|uniref:Cenp-O kinetochore centromere component domain-containing protein n=1 Tax=Hirsutella rhossiliensis TaxID=111463 RepID=A0A9P8MY95_9HYPO|nr:cenp-O kinetochore centromere component domain-containing protein [Hirsutella rhossiliensis]KAH0964273.1 cenp-O kinetochore centromere component domain-containing protein [Hirsutella rhossiliensis]